MKIMSFVVGGALVATGFFINSAVAQAYETRAIPLSPTQTLLITTYTETLLNRDGVVPFIAHSDANASHDPLVASFEVRGRNVASLTSGTQSALILSDRPIANGGYTLAEGEKATLMLITIVTHNTGALDLKAELTSLPILITRNGKPDSKTIKSY